jgi:hypothetical protein
MEHSCPKEADNSSVFQEILRTLLNAEVNYRVHKNLTQVPILNQMDLFPFLISIWSNLYYPLFIL